MHTDTQTHRNAETHTQCRVLGSAETVTVGPAPPQQQVSMRRTCQTPHVPYDGKGAITGICDVLSVPYSVAPSSTRSTWFDVRLNGAVVYSPALTRMVPPPTQSFRAPRTPSVQSFLSQRLLYAASSIEHTFQPYDALRRHATSRINPRIGRCCSTFIQSNTVDLPERKVFFWC